MSGDIISLKVAASVGISKVDRVAVGVVVAEGYKALQKKVARVVVPFEVEPFARIPVVREAGVQQPLVMGHAQNGLNPIRIMSGSQVFAALSRSFVRFVFPILYLPLHSKT